MESAASIPSAFSTLASALAALPPTLSKTNLTLLTSLLQGFSVDIAPVLPALVTAQQDALLANTTFLAGQVTQLGSVTAQIPPGDVAGATPDDLAAIIELGLTRYSILTFWAPEVWAILLAYTMAVALKVALVVLVGRQVLRRTGEVAKAQGRNEDVEATRAVVLKPAKAALGHALNFFIAAIALLLQFCAWRLFVLPSAPVRMNDIRYLSVAMKTLLVGYGADLLFSDLRPEIFLHHLFTFALLFVGQLAAFETKSPKFFRLAQWLILQATTEQSTYAAMVAYHYYNYLRVQNHHPLLQRRLLTFAWKVLRFTRWTTFPQKLLPSAFAVYWLGRMWNEIDGKAWGRAWLAWCTVILSLLMVLQVVFCDDIFPLAAYIGYKLNGRQLPPRRGPVLRALARVSCFRRAGSRRGVRPSAPAPAPTMPPPFGGSTATLPRGSEKCLEEGTPGMSAAEWAEGTSAELVELRRRVDLSSSVSSRGSYHNRRSNDTAWSAPLRPLSLVEMPESTEGTVRSHASGFPLLTRSQSAPAPVQIVIESPQEDVGTAK
ncbi:hypothetical protein JCM3770_003837 [Rhodotorula araucariae]